jgi:spore maturation protein CgeB
MTDRSIFLVGTFAPGTLEFSYKRAFEEIGARTFTFAADNFRHQLNWLMWNRLTYRLTIRSRQIRKMASQAYNRSLRDAVLQSNAPLLLVLKGEFVMEETLHELRRKGIRIAYYYPDNPFPPHPSQRPETLPVARETDLYLIWSERLVQSLKKAGVRNPVFLPFAWDAEAFPFQESQPQGVWPGVLFLGGWDKTREAFLEEVASSLPLRIYGPEYWGTRTKPRSRVRRCWQGSALRSSGAARAIRESAVSLNVLRNQHIIDGVPDGLIMRHFEVPGAGGFLLSTRGGGATELFPEGKTGEYFSTTAECIEKAKWYIANESPRRSLAAAAHLEVCRQHRYTDRAREILRLLAECR